jgi:hypothetical protein
MNKIAAALVKAQRAFGPALKDKTNPAFRSKYADLGACIDAVMDALNDAGIALIQKQHPHEGGVCIETVFIHESGEQISAGMFTVPASKQDAQGYGSATTYARRYSLMAAFGVPAEDDDGNAAAASAPSRQAAPRTDDVEAAVILDSLREAATAGVDALQERFRAIPTSATKAAVWQKHSASLKSAAEKAGVSA